MTPSRDRADAAHTPWMPSPATFGRISTSGTNRANGSREREDRRLAALSERLQERDAHDHGACNQVGGVEEEHPEIVGAHRSDGRVGDEQRQRGFRRQHRGYPRTAAPAPSSPGRRRSSACARDRRVRRRSSSVSAAGCRPLLMPHKGMKANAWTRSAAPSQRPAIPRRPMRRPRGRRWLAGPARAPA